MAGAQLEPPLKIYTPPTSTPSSAGRAELCHGLARTGVRQGPCDEGKPWLQLAWGASTSFLHSCIRSFIHSFILCLLAPSVCWSLPLAQSSSECGRGKRDFRWGCAQLTGQQRKVVGKVMAKVSRLRCSVGSPAHLRSELGSAGCCWGGRESMGMRSRCASSIPSRAS